MASGKEQRCGTCELLVRSSFPGLHTYGKCPHRHGWVRTHQAACEHHLAARRSRLVAAAMLVNLGAAAVGFASFAIIDIREGKLWSHLVLGGIAVLIAIFVWGVRRFDLLSEEPKFQLLDDEDPPVEDDRGVGLR
ncbi:MAG TPA: hypothetical protein VMU15_17620 [Anaeromyxobacter sp.]|nr:hypothetical protein [Anaeromyxobacter sp.]